ncbi:MAG: hypothetical protein SGARI_004508 [Bacillariaceae sp.]
MYLWARRNPNANMQLNFLPIQGRYLPLAHVGISYALNNPVQPLLHGCAVGHVTGRRVWQTPSILVNLVGGGEDDVFMDNDDDDGNGDNIQHAAPMNNQQRVQEMMQRDRASPAHIAAKSGSLQQLQQIASQSTTIHLLAAPDRNGWQPLHEAVRGGHLECVEFLVGQNEVVDIFARTNSGETPLALAQRCHAPQHPVTRRLMGLVRELAMNSEGRNNNEYGEVEAGSTSGDEGYVEVDGS